MSIQQMLISSIGSGSTAEKYWTNSITNSNTYVTLYDHALDSLGNIYACGGVSNNDGFVYKISKDGNLIKAVQLDNGTTANQILGICIDSSDNVYFYAGQGRVGKYNSDLELQYQNRIAFGNGTGFNDGDTISNGSIFLNSSETELIIGGKINNGNYHMCLSVDPTNGQVITGRYIQGGSGTGAVVSHYGMNQMSNGTIYVCGKVNGPQTYYYDYPLVSIMTSSGAFSRVYKFYNDVTGQQARAALSNTVNGKHYVVGKAKFNGGNNSGDAFILRAGTFTSGPPNNNGIEVCKKETSNSGRSFLDIAQDSLGNVYAVTSFGEIIKFDMNLDIIWSRSLGSNEIRKISIDANDNIWMNVGGSGGNCTIAKISSDGYALNKCSINLGTYTQSTHSYSDQAGGQYTSVNPWYSSAEPIIWGGLVNNSETPTESTITPASNKCEIEDAVGQQTFLETGSHSWTCPPGVYLVSAVCVGGGGAGNGDNQSGSGGAAGGGGLGYRNNIPVTPGQSYTVFVASAADGGSGNDGEDSYFINTSTVMGGGGKGSTNTNGGNGGSYTGEGGGNGGSGGAGGSTYEGGGGGAGGYTGSGGNGGFGNGSTHPSSTSLSDRKGDDGTGGAGGGGGYGGGYTGGGVGILGAGAPGLGGAYSPPSGVPFGSGTAGSGGSGISFGGGGSGAGAQGGSGAVRIMWGRNRAYPNTNTGNVNDRVGQQEFTTVGTNQWICPVGVYFVSVVCVGAGGASSGYNAFSGQYEEGNGGGGAGLGYNNYIPVTPGQSYNVVVGAAGQVQTLPSSAGGSKTNSSGDSYFINTSIVKGGAGENALPGSGGNGSGGSYAGDGGANGGSGGSGDATYGPGGGGGAAGYTGNGGSGGGGSTSSNSTSGQGGGGGGGAHGYLGSGSFTNAAGGGGVGIEVKGSNGSAGSIQTSPMQEEWTSPGTYSWTCPDGVTSVCVVAVGAGGDGGGDKHGDGGGGLGWKNNISVTAGQSYTVVVGNKNSGGGDSYFINPSTVRGGGGNTSTTNNGGTGGGYVGDGGGSGGQGGSKNGSYAGGGGGAGGYSGNGGNGGTGISFGASSGNAGTGGAGGGGAGANWEGGAGGGVGLQGEGASGLGASTYYDSGSYQYGHCGQGGSGGLPQTWAAFPSLGPGSGGGGGNGIAGQHGAVRIIWGTGRAFPSTNTADQSSNVTIEHGGGGSGGASFGTGVGISTIMKGGLYGGGSGGASNQTANGGVSDGIEGSDGAVRIIWGYNRSYPQNNTGTGQNGEPIQGAEEFTTAGTFSWTCPDNVSSVCVVAIGGGGGGAGAYDGSNDNSRGSGGGGGLGYKNNISVTPGQSYTVVVGDGGGGGQGGTGSAQLSRGGDGGDSYFIDATTVKGGAGLGGDGQSYGGDFVGDNDGVGNSSNYGGRNGGYGHLTVGMGGAGAAGYSGVGAGDGRGVTVASGGGSGSGASAQGVGGVSYSSSGGGGTGIYGEGATGANGTNVTPPGRGGFGGSGGENGDDGVPNTQSHQGQDGGKYGGGGGAGQMQHLGGNVYYGASGGDGAVGAVRIIWGPGRAFPNYNAGDI